MRLLYVDVKCIKDFDSLRFGLIPLHIEHIFIEDQHSVNIYQRY